MGFSNNGSLKRKEKIMDKEIMRLLTEMQLNIDEISQSLSELKAQLEMLTKPLEKKELINNN